MNEGTVVPLFSHGVIQPRLLQEEVTVDKLKAALEAAVIETIIDDEGDLYLREGVDVPMWISIDPGSKLVHFHSYWPSTANVEPINQLNCKYKIVQFSRHDDRVVTNYQMTYRYGLDTRHMISMARDFASICRKGHQELEKEGEKDASVD